MRKIKIVIHPSYKGNGIKIIGSKDLVIESLPGYIEELLSRWQWHYDQMIEDEDTLISLEKITQFGQLLAKELQGYLPEYNVKALNQAKMMDQMCTDLDMLADQCKNQNLYYDLIKYYNKKVNLDNTNLKFSRDLAIAKFNSEQYNDALTDLEALPDDLKEGEVIKFLIGMCHFKLQNFANAEKIFCALLEKSPNDRNYLLAQSENYICIYEYDKACSLLERATLLEPDNEDIKYRLANCYNFAERFCDEKRILMELVKNSPTDITLLGELSCSLFCCKEYYSSIEILKRILTLDPDEGDCYFNLALNYYKLKMDNFVIDYYLKALLRNPKFTRLFWEKDNFLLNQNIDLKLLLEIISFGAEYGDEKAKEFLETNSLKNEGLLE